ncbi:MAG TPA: YceD family protein [Acidimicrobiales bacterium]
MTAARPLQVGVSELLRHPGSRRAFAAEVVLDGLETSVAAVPEGGAVAVDLTLESLSVSVVATGSVTVPWTGLCRRCLDPVHGDAVTDVREIFEHDAVEGETYPLTGETLDLEPMVRDAALLALPLAPLCREDCRGPAPEAFPTGLADDGAEAPDPRWAALEGLRFDE